MLPGGADWQIVRADGFTELDTRYTLETDKGQLIYVQNAGMRHAPPDVMQKLLAGEAVDPALVYFRTVPKFETSAPELQWLTRAIFIGTGERYPTDVVDPLLARGINVTPTSTAVARPLLTHAPLSLGWIAAPVLRTV